MVRDDELLNQLAQALNETEKNLGPSGRVICQKELAEITAAIGKISHESNKKTISDLGTTIKNIIARIESEVLALENEMHGVEGYSDYEYERMKKCEWKIILRNELGKMLVHIHEYEKQMTHPV